MTNSIIICCRYVLPLLLSSIMIALTGCSTQQTINQVTVNNLFQVSPDVYRSGQPSSTEMLELKKLGIQTVINLRLMHDDRNEVEEAGLTSHWIRLRAGHITNKKMIEVLKLINSSPKPVLVHCWHGSDRTGVVIAMYRMVFQDWTKEQAIAELMQPEYGYHYNIYANIKKYLQNVDVSYIRQQVLEQK